MTLPNTARSKDGVVVTASSQINEAPILSGNEKGVINAASSGPGTTLPALARWLSFLSMF